MKFRVLVEGQYYEVDVEDVSQRPVIAYVDGERVEVWPEAAPTVPEIHAASNGNGTQPAPAPAAPVSTTSSKAIAAPIPGVIDTVQVKPGDTVANGQAICTLEAMKMKNIIRANRAGTIAEVHITPGQQVNHGDVLVTFAES